MDKSLVRAIRLTFWKLFSLSCQKRFTKCPKKVGWKAKKNKKKPKKNCLKSFRKDHFTLKLLSSKPCYKQVRRFAVNSEINCSKTKTWINKTFVKFSKIPFDTQVAFFKTRLKKQFRSELRNQSVEDLKKWKNKTFLKSLFTKNVCLLTKEVIKKTLIETKPRHSEKFSHTVREKFYKWEFSSGKSCSLENTLDMQNAALRKSVVKIRSRVQKNIARNRKSTGIFWIFGNEFD